MNPLTILKYIEKNFNVYIISLIIFGIPIILFEVVGIALIFPIVSNLTDVNQTNIILSKLFSFLDDFEISTNILILSVLILFLAKNFLTILYNFFTHTFTHLLFIEVSETLMKNELSNNYLNFIKKTNSLFLRNLRDVPSSVSTYISSYISYIIELLTLIFIVSLLLAVSFKATLISGIFISIIFYFINRYSKNRSRIWGENRLDASEKLSKILIAIFKNFIEVNFFGKKDFFLKFYKSQNFKFSNEYRKIIFLSSVTKYIIEVVIILFLLFFSLFFLIDVNLNSYLATIAVYAFSFFRILPSLNRIINQKLIINYNLKPYKEAVEILLNKNNDYKVNKKTSTEEKYNFSKNIKFENISFSYPATDNRLFNKLNFKINKNTFFGIKGSSGSGKSTILKLLLGIISPEQGKILVDDKHDLKEINLNFLKNIGYVSQNFYLLNDTIAKNIALEDEEEINLDKCWKALKLAKCDEFVNKLPNRINTKISEDAVDLSGGQRQRLSIARALYNNPQILIFDEATSSLDLKTEEQILNDLYNLKNIFTIIIVSHKLETMKYCDEILELD